MESFSKSKVGKSLIIFASSLTVFVSDVKDVFGEEYKGRLTADGKARIEALMKQMAQNIVTARNQAVQDSNLKSMTKEIRPDGSEVWSIETNDGVKIQAINPAENKNNAHPVSEPTATKNPYFK